MKLCFFDDFRFGLVKNGTHVIDLMPVLEDVPRIHPHDLLVNVIENFGHFRPLFGKAAGAAEGIPLAGVRFRPPVPRPLNIDCMAVNYMEDGTRKEPAPINGFAKTPLSVIGHGDTMVLPDVPASVFEGEAEVAVIIGKPTDQISDKDAMSHVFGYMNFIDGSARGLAPSGNTFYQAKSRATFAPIGPWIVTADEIEDPQHLQIRLWNNGVLKQNFNTSDMAHSIAKSIAFVSSLHPLLPGDILATGTNHRGLHALQDGDRLDLEAEGLGRLSVTVSDPLKRSWPRETRLERQQKGLEPMAVQSSGKYSDAMR